jgi:hypothetical protein
MRRLSLAVAAVSLLAAAALPAAASATEVQVGSTSTALAAPTCPNNDPNSACTIVLYKMTAIETVSDGMKYPTTITQPGVLYSYNVGISVITTNASERRSVITSENNEWGGAPEVQLTVLRPVGTGSARRWQVAAQGPVQTLTNYLGTVTQFSLTSELPVVKGEVVALTTPTWAPVLTINLSTSQFGYAQSRTGNCSDNSKLPTYVNPQTALGNIASYGCSFTGTRIEYDATEIETTTIAAADRLAARPHRASKPRILSR